MILNDYSTLDARFLAAGATSHPIVILCKVLFLRAARRSSECFLLLQQFLRVRALVDCEQSQTARELFASIDEMPLPGQWSVMRLWCSAHIAYDSQHMPVTDSESIFSSSTAAFSNCDEMLSSWATIQRTLPSTHRLCLRSQFNIACARASLGSCDGVQLLEPVLSLQRQHLGSSHCDVLECAVALADYLPSDARSSTDSESVVTDAMRELSRLCGPCSPSFIRAHLVWLRICCSRGKGSSHFTDILPSIQSILNKMKGMLWFSAFEEKKLQLLHAQALAQASSWQPAADKLLKWQADHCKDNRLKMHLPIMQSYSLATQVFEHLGDVTAVERQHDYAICRSFSQHHLLLWAKGKQLLQMGQKSIIHKDSSLNSSTAASANSAKLSICESAAKAFSVAELSLSHEDLTPLIVSFRCHCKLRAAEAFICSGSDIGLASARELCEACDALCRCIMHCFCTRCSSLHCSNGSLFRMCQPDDSTVSCLMLRMRANILSASGSDPAFIEVLCSIFFFVSLRFESVSLQELYKQSAVLASSLPLQRSAHMSLQSLRVSLGHYSKAKDADIFAE
jgi:hypothetical protein